MGYTKSIVVRISEVWPSAWSKNSSSYETVILRGFHPFSDARRPAHSATETGNWWGALEVLAGSRSTASNTVLLINFKIATTKALRNSFNDNHQFSENPQISVGVLNRIECFLTMQVRLPVCSWRQCVNIIEKRAVEFKLYLLRKKAKFFSYLLVIKISPRHFFENWRWKLTTVVSFPNQKWTLYIDCSGSTVCKKFAFRNSIQLYFI